MAVTLECGHNPPQEFSGPLTAAPCKACWFWHNDPDYRNALERRAARKAAAAYYASGASGRARCAHLGRDLKTLALCGSCKGRVQLKVFACAEYGRCTLEKPAVNQAEAPGCCNGCLKFRVETPPLFPDVPPPRDGFFGRVFVISLERTPDRLSSFKRRWPADWPYRQPELFPAVDGQAASLPKNWNDWQCAEHVKRGAYGCHQSWTTILRQCLADDVQRPILVFEDDAQLTDDWHERLASYLASLPEHWQLAYLGCQHMKKPIALAPGIVQVTEGARTHALAVNRHFQKTLLAAWDNWGRHVDWRLQSMASQCRFFAPDPPLAGQAANRSIIMGRNEGYRDWRG
jgi:Glycosyltransferase family 25 (LPS biosynthesis protein)